jgi:hypothetical protein
VSHVIAVVRIRRAIADTPCPIDPLSYQCLYHLLVTKAFVTVLSSLIIIVLFPISVGTIVLLPAMLEMIRRFGRWQAGLSVESLQ